MDINLTRLGGMVTGEKLLVPNSILRWRLCRKYYLGQDTWLGFYWWEMLFIPWNSPQRPSHNLKPKILISFLSFYNFLSKPSKHSINPQCNKNNRINKQIIIIIRLEFRKVLPLRRCTTLMYVSVNMGRKNPLEWFVWADGWRLEWDVLGV